MYFMSTACGRPQGEVLAHVDEGEGGVGQKPDFFVDVINGWPLNINILSVVYYSIAGILPSLDNRG